MHRSVMAKTRCGGGRGSVVATSAAVARLGVDALTTSSSSSSFPPFVVASAIIVTPPLSHGGNRKSECDTASLSRRRHHHHHRLHHHHSLVATSRGPPVVIGSTSSRNHHSSAKLLASAADAIDVRIGRGDATGATAASSSPPPSSPTSTASASTSTTMDEHRRAILASSLAHVPEHGWTEDALAAGVASSNLPPSTIGLVTGGGSDLVAFFMDRCNDDLRSELDEISAKWDDEEGGGLRVAERIRRSLRMRLEMVAPYVRCGRWHEAMAIGAQLLPYGNNAARTAAQLEEMVDIVVERGCRGVRMGAVERTAIGAAYVATELHMLADASDGFGESWTFLGTRVDDLEWLANNMSGGVAGIARGDLAVAASAVATSLGGAVLSLAQPAGAGVTSALASSVLFPRMATFMQNVEEDEDSSSSATSSEAEKSTTGSAAVEDFSDLPPFETDVDGGVAAGLRK